MIGWRAMGEIALVVAVGLVGYEWLFAEWRKMPFTCSRLPGKTPLWITFLYGIGLVVFVPILNMILSAALFSGAGFTFVLVMTAVAWRRIHAARRESRGELKLKYDEGPGACHPRPGPGQVALPRDDQRRSRRHDSRRRQPPREMRLPEVPVPEEHAEQTRQLKQSQRVPHLHPPKREERRRLHESCRQGKPDVERPSGSPCR